MNYVKELLAGLLAGLMAAGTATVTVLQEAALTEVGDGQWVTIAIGGFLAAAAGWRTLLTSPPDKK